MSVRPPTRILVAEDDPDIGSLLEHYLKKAGFLPTLVASGRDVMPQIKRDTPDLVVLDLMLPGLDGLQLCRAIRADADDRGDSDHHADGQGRGIRSHRRPRARRGRLHHQAVQPERSGGARHARCCGARIAPRRPTTGMSYGTLTVDVDRHVVKVSGDEVKLTAKEFLLLQYLMQHRGRVLSRDLLLSDVWSYSYTGGTRTVDVHVRRLREKVPMLADAIVTVKQFGYKLLDPAPA